MAFSISFIVQAVDKFSSVARGIGKSLDNIKTHADKVSKSIGNVSKSLTELGKKAFTHITLPLGAVSAMALKSAASIETMQVGFDTLLQSKEKGAQMMQDILKFAQFTPFEMEDIGNSVRQLLGANVPLQDIIKNLTMIADVASGVNVPLTDMTHIIAKAKNKSKAQAEELNQMAERGIPIMQELARMSKSTAAQIYKEAEAGKITYEVILAALKNMTEEGGMFYKMSEKQSQTLIGIWSTLKDVIYFTLGDLGMAIVEAFDLKTVMQNTVKWLEKLQVKMREFIKENPTLTKWIIIIAAISSVLAPLLITLGIAIKLFQFLGIGIKGVAIALRLLFLSPIGLAILAITGLAIGIIYLYNKSETFRRIINGVGIVLWTLLKGVWNLGRALFFVLNPLNLFKAIFNKLYTGFEPFKCMIDWLVDKLMMIPVLIDKVVNAIVKLKQPIKDFLGNASSNMVAFDTAKGAPSPVSAAQSPLAGKIRDANARVDINIVDKNNNVKSYDSKTKGFLNLAVGKNMGYI
jgi:tape measure domain-containing protein